LNFGKNNQKSNSEEQTETCNCTKLSNVQFEIMNKIFTTSKVLIYAINKYLKLFLFIPCNTNWVKG